jgi:CRP-like cAMP-binding protein
MTPVSKTRYLDHLRNVPIFARCTKKQLDHVASIVTELRLPKGTEVMAEGSMAHEFIVIQTGTATVKRGGRKIASLGAGDVVGELALILHRPRNATVMAETDLSVLVVDARSFERLLNEVPGLARQLLTTVAERLADTSKPTELLH